MKIANFNFREKPDFRFLKKIREDEGYTLRQVEEKTGVTVTVQEYFENGKGSPKGDALLKIMAFYELSISDFFPSLRK